MKVMIGIEIKSAEARLVEGVANRTGRPYSFREQSGWADMGKSYPVEVRFVLGDKQQAYAPGRYYLDESAVSVDRNGGFVINLRALKPVAQAAATVTGAAGVAPVGRAV